MKNFSKMIKNEKHFTSVLHGFSEAFVTGKFCDVKVVCKDTNLWAHRLVLGSVSPFLRALLVDFERRGDDVITIFLPLIKGYHMKLVLDYIYSGAMYLCGAHMQYVIQVMEVLQLKCGVSVNKMVKASEEGLDPEKQWIEIEHSTMHLKEYDSDHEIHRSEDELDNDVAKEKEVEVNSVNTDIVDTEKITAVSENAKGELDDTENIKQVSCTSLSTVKDSDMKSTGGDDSEDDNDVVMVELDEDFVVERVEQHSSQDDFLVEVVGEAAAPSHRCVLCGRTFAHYDNLQVHLTGHLGVKVHLNRCHTCKRNFRNKNEMNLHMQSHKFAKMLGKYKVNKTREEKNVAIKNKIISTVGTKDKKIVRKYVKKREENIMTRKIERAKTPKKSEVGLSCRICDKSFGRKNIYVRHVKKFHPELAETLLQSLPSVKVRNCHKTPTESIITNGTSKSKRTPISPKKFQDSFEKYENPALGTPNRFFDKIIGEKVKKTPKAKTPKPGTIKTAKVGTPKTPKTGGAKSFDYYSTLECPDCGRIFIAKSIFERHLQSARHGHYAGTTGGYQGSVSGAGGYTGHVSGAGGVSPASDGYPQWPGGYSSPLTPNPSTSSQEPLRAPTVTLTDSPVYAGSDIGSPTSPRIECHLCGQTFVRVKDLAKHREKVCSAYHNVAKKK